MLVSVRNKKTGEIKYYTLNALDALRAAWLQERGQYDTGNYAIKEVPVVRRGACLKAGAWEVLNR